MAPKKGARRKSDVTPKSQIRKAIDMLWLRSRERSAALKRTGYCCERCRRKQSKKKGHEVRIDVHHVEGCDRAWLSEMIREHLLQSPDRLMPLCVECHAAEHKEDKG